MFNYVDSIELGDDFVDVITAAVGSCDVPLMLIGDQWVRSSTEITARFVYLVMLLLLCCGMRFGSRGGPTSCRLAGGDLMIQQQAHDAYPVGRLWSDRPAGRCDEATRCFRAWGLAIMVACRTASHPVGEANLQGIAGGVEFVAAQSTAEIESGLGACWPVGVRSSHLPYENSGLLNRFRL